MKKQGGLVVRPRTIGRLAGLSVSQCPNTVLSASRRNRSRKAKFVAVTKDPVSMRCNEQFRRSGVSGKTQVSRVATIATFFVLLGIMGTIPRTSGQSGTVISSTLFGMHLIGRNNSPQDSVGALGKGTCVNWAYSEPQRGVFNWANLDAWVQNAGNNHIDFFFSNDRVPPWAAADQGTCGPTYPGSTVIGCTSAVANIKDWDDFVTALATRYKGKLIYELWNEPNGKTFTGTIADMVTLTTHEYNIIRSIDPGALIVTPSCTYGTSGAAACLDQYFSAGGPTGVDVISWHAYWLAPEQVINEINKMRAVMAKYGIPSKPLWDTEGSWTSGLTTDQQAGFVARFYLLQGSMGVSRFYWYAWDSPQFGTMWDPVGGSHPDAIAYQQVYNWLVGANISGPCTMASNSTWTCSLTRPGGHQALAVWNALGSVSYAPASIYTDYKDLSGNTHQVQGSVQIGYNPILLENQNQPPPPTKLTLTVN
jgi:hypothetical protein